MSFCSYAGGNPMYGFTPVSNLFFTEYMGNAPKEYIPVYLYGLMLCHTPCEDGGIGKIASALNIDENTVLNAFKYWEREGLVEKLSDNPPSYSYIPLSPDRMKEKDEVYENRDYFRELQIRLPNLILDGHELRMASEWEDDLHLTHDTILFMVDTEVAKRGGKLPTAQTLFKHLNETAMKLAEAGATELNAAKEFLALESSYATCAKAVCKQLSFRRNPTVDEIALATKWMESWKLDINVILESCAETVKSGNPSFAYLDKILEARVSGKNDDDGFEQVKKLCAHLGIVTRPTPAQLDACREFLNMGFEFSAVEQAAVWCGENNRRTFDDIRRKLEAWAKEGAFTLQDIEEKAAEQKKYMEIVKRIFEEAAVDRKITLSDLKLTKVWTALIEEDAVYYAASMAKGSANAMQYINKVIQTWSASGVTTLEKAKAAASVKPITDTKKKPMDERTVTETEFETGFFADIMNRQRTNDHEQN